MTAKSPARPIVGFVALGATVLGLLATTIFVRTAYESRYIPSESMKPTLQKDDRILVDRLAYQGQGPQRGDLIIFNPTESLQAQNFKDAFVKRVIGLPGETVAVKGGKVLINNQPIQEQYIAEPPEYQWGPARVPDNAYFVLGDNRNNAYDSHYWGYVSRDLIIGKVTRIYWPPDRAKSFK